MPDTRITGSCQCGDVRFSAPAPPVHANHCHCLDCQKQSGAAMMSWVTFRRNELVWENQPPERYESSNTARRGFCPRCGSTVTWESVSKTDYVDVAAGLMDGSPDVDFAEHLFWARHRDWLDIGDPLPKHQTWPPGRDPDPEPDPA